MAKTEKKELSIYRKFTRETAQYPGALSGDSRAINYCTLALVGEAGELANKFKKVLRGDKKADPEFKHQMVKELGDVMWYAERLADELGYSMHDVIDINMAKIAARKKAGTLKGDGDDR